MDVVLDANVLFRTLISHGNILEIMFNPNLQLFAPQKLREEFLAHKKEIIQKSHLSQTTFHLLCSQIFKKIIFVDVEEYKRYLPKAKNVLRSHRKDEDFIALCIMKKCKVWTYESRLFDIGYGISTSELSKKLA
jgi:predicted nucleic acid-binding protein